jgi:PilZ domain
VKLGRSKQAASKPMPLPERSTGVTLRTDEGGSIPARVIEQSPHSLLIAITVPTRPFTPKQLAGLVLEYHSERGRIRLHGSFSVDDPSDPDLVRLLEPRSVEVLQERSYVRIRAARPVLVYTGSSGGQISSFTVDISGGGFMLAGPDTLPVGDEVRFRLSLDSDGLPVTGTARVVRIDPQGRRAVSFETISDLDRRRLVRFIFECQRAERRRGLKPEERNGR